MTIKHIQDSSFKSGCFSRMNVKLIKMVEFINTKWVCNVGDIQMFSSLKTLWNLYLYLSMVNEIAYNMMHKDCLICVFQCYLRIP